MQRILILLLVVLASCIGANAQKQSTTSRKPSVANVKKRNAVVKKSTVAANANSKSAKGPIISFLSTQRNFGELKKDSKTEWVAKFKNSGDEKLVITGVNAFCSCMSAEAPKDFIAPGDSGQIVVTFHAETVGDFMKNLQVYTNCSTPMVRLYIQGKVVDE